MKSSIKTPVSTALILGALAILLDTAGSAPQETGSLVLTKALVVAFPEGSCRLVVPYDPEG